MSKGTGLQLRSLVKGDGQLELSLVPVDVPTPAADEILIRVEAAPINPSDLGLLLGPADPATVTSNGSTTQPVVTAPISEAGLRAVAGRLDQSLPVGNEGAGIVVEAGASATAQAMLGKTVAMVGGAMYAQYRCVKAADVLVLQAGTTPAEGASAFINPLTALGMVETMRRENHTALVHTAAASNLGQMLNRICQKDGIELVNIVRNDQHAGLLRDIGAKHICNSAAPGFMDDLTQALIATGATLAFDAIGGGELASQILTCMEMAANRQSKVYSRYGSTVHKQVYVYGNLDLRPTELKRGYGMAWSVGGWLLFPFLQKIGSEAAQRLRDRVAAELKTTFASGYSKVVSLHEALLPANIEAYSKRATGTKFLINPNKAD